MKKKGTICVHGGYSPKNAQPRQLPIYQSTTWKYDSSDDMAKLFDLEAEGYFYTRLQNPTSDAAAAKICELEGGEAALLTASGQAAIFFAIMNLCKAGDHIISSAALYGGTANLFSLTLKKFGIESTMIDPDASREEMESAFRTNTKLVYAESLSNPSNIVLDIEKFAKAAHDHGVPLIIDNTFPSPISCRPFEWGADIVLHSTTKYMDGHASAVGGCIVDSGNFDWSAYPERFAEFNEPDPSYHGLVYTKAFGRKAFIIKATVQLMRDLGSSPSPFNSWILNHGLETLELRIRRHLENAKIIAEYLNSHQKVAWVKYPGLKEDPYYELAQKYMPKGCSGVIAFSLRGEREEAVRFMDHLQLISIATHVCDNKSIVLHPASHTHRQLSDAQLKAAGIDAGLIRLSLGIEDAQDILQDLEEAFSYVEV
ncbi:MAG: aminotransferase class I/II-fold pyridoxal phosphate-dependent enzyme [Johnsonella sp.]|nr:aminotransferase class I/II-fold pyridoxal phosphate-dependent enzyme [Johnsonella sp.]